MSDRKSVITQAPGLSQSPGAEPASEAPPAGEAVVELRGICKSFHDLAALDQVDLDLRRGEVHALLGENGAGKSTLCSILAGLYRAEAGTIVIDGTERRFRSPQGALEHGIGMVYQHYRLVDQFTVAENLVLGHPELPIRLSRRDLERAAAELMDRYGIAVDPGAYVGDLSVGEQQRVEVLKLLARGIRVLILDEPTAVLAPPEAQALLAAMRSLAQEGATVVFVSHKLNEVREVSDRITVLRDGRRVTTVEAASADERLLAAMMVEREPGAVEPPARRLAGTKQDLGAPAGEPALSVRGLSVLGDRGEEAVRGVDLEVAAAEIVGIAGVAGNGQLELAEAISGMREPVAGRISLRGTDVTRASVKERADRGLGYVPEDRMAVGMVGELSYEENVALRSYWRPPFARGPLLARGEMARAAARQRERFDVRGVRPGVPVRVLSGGNLQRAILARETAADPAILIAACPSRGLDVRAAENVRRLLAEQRVRGAGVLLISEDLEELLALCDRLIVLYEGRAVGELTADDADPERIGLLVAGIEEPR